MKPIIIAGNGPSLLNIDYTRLPQDFDTFRCNQFFFEDKYYLGNKVTGFFSGIPTFESLFATTTILEDRKEYIFEDKYFSGLIVDQVKEFNRNILADFFTMKVACDFCFQNKKIARFINQQFITYGKYPTTGIIMIFTAIALGYTDIYITGLDFYSTGHNYAFEVDSSLIQISPWDKDSSHSIDLEYKSIEFAKSIDGVTIYSLNPSSILSEKVLLAPIINNRPYIPEEKPKNYINTIILSARQQKTARQEELRQEELAIQKTSKQGLIQSLKQKFQQKNLEAEWAFLQNNMLIKFIYNTVKLPYVLLKVIIKYIKKS